jgi:hypothetical protein
MTNERLSNAQKDRTMAAGQTMRRRAGALTICAAAAVGVSIAGSPTAKADDDVSRFTYARLYCTPDNQSHFADVTAELTKENFAPPASPIAIGGSKPASKAFIGGFAAHWGTNDLQTRLYHPTPAIQQITVLQGEFAITVSDGETRQLRPGGVLMLEDAAPCKGHITVVGDKPGFLLFAR